MDRLQDEDTIDVYLTLCMMRIQRCNMVQTEVILTLLKLFPSPKLEKGILITEGMTLLLSNDCKDILNFKILSKLFCLHNRGWN